MLAWGRREDCLQRGPQGAPVPSEAGQAQCGLGGLWGRAPPEPSGLHIAEQQGQSVTRVLSPSLPPLPPLPKMGQGSRIPVRETRWTPLDP